MVTVLNYVIHLFDICSIVRKQYLDLWQVGKIISGTNRGARYDSNMVPHTKVNAMSELKKKNGLHFNFKHSRCSEIKKRTRYNKNSGGHAY